MPDGFFPPRPGASPTIYAYASTHPDHKGLVKGASTERHAAERRAGQSHGQPTEAEPARGLSAWSPTVSEGFPVPFAKTSPPLRSGCMVEPPHACPPRGAVG